MKSSISCSFSRPASLVNLIASYKVSTACFQNSFNNSLSITYKFVAPVGFEPTPNGLEPPVLAITP